MNDRPSSPTGAHPRAVKVTVLMTLYNKAEFVEEAVRSVLSQTFTDLELLVIDDASTDGGPDRVRAIDDPRITIVRSPVNRGRPASANLGFDRAAGEYIAILDADDVMLPDRLEEQVAFLDREPKVMVVGSWLQCFGARNDLWKYPTDDAQLKGRMLFKVDVPYPACMLRRAYIQREGIRCPEDWLIPGMDFLFLLKVGMRGGYANIPKALTMYRVGPQNMRHGRDPLADRIARNRQALATFTLPAGAREAEAMALLDDPHLRPLNAAMLRSIDRWIDDVSRTNRDQGNFPAEHLEAYMEQRWRQLYHVLPGSSAAAWSYLFLRPSGRTWARCNEVLRATVKEALARLTRS